MKMNTTGKADIIIRAYSNFGAAKKTFKKGQPITILKDISYNLSFHSENREMRAGIKNLGAFSNYAPYQISIEPVNITRSLASILYTEKISSKTFFLPINEIQESDETGTIYLNERNNDGSISDKEVFVLDNVGELVLAAVDYVEGKISDLDAKKLYHIAYYIESDLEFGYKLGKTNAPYFSLEIINRDDYGSQGINTFIYIPKTSLLIDPELNFDKDNITNISLIFNILDEDIEMIFH